MPKKKDIVDPKGVSLLRLQHRHKALIALRDHPGISRSELGGLLGVTRNTATLIINELLDKGFVYEEGEKKAISGAGRPGKALFLESGNILFGGCIFKEDEFSVVIGDYSGKILREETVKVEDSEPTLYLSKVSRSLAQLEEEYPNIQRWGIGVPGLIDEMHGRILYTARLGWRSVDVISVIQRQVEKPCRLVNRIQAASLMSADFLLTENYRNAFYFHLTTGIGGASLTLMPDGRHYETSMREIGHFCVVEEGKPCTCGNRGCLEQYASSAAIEESIRQYERDSLSYAAAKEKALREAGRYVGKALAQTVNLLLPDAIIIDGSYAGEKAFQEQIVRICRANGLSQIIEKLKFHFLELEKSQILGILTLGIRDFDQETII